MTKFHEGQDVEVTQTFDCGVAVYGWRKAKIVREIVPALWLRINEPHRYLVQFPDGSRAVCNAEHIRTIDGPSREAAKKVARELGERLMGRAP